MENITNDRKHPINLLPSQIDISAIKQEEILKNQQLKEGVIIPLDKKEK